MFDMRKTWLVAACAAACVPLSACGSRRSGPAGAATGASYTIGGSVNAFSGVLGLQDVFGPTGGATTTDPLSLSAAGNFTFTQKVPQGDGYAVSVATQPTGQYCSVANSSGVASANVSHVTVGCAAGTLKLLYANTSSANGAGVPSSLWVTADGTVIGETQGGGSASSGVLYAYFPSTHALQVLYNFQGGTTDGAQPLWGLTRLGNYLYGVTQSGGANGTGTIFRWQNGTEQILHSFAASSTAGSATAGVNPFSPLLLASDGNLYGLVNGGGANGEGGIYRLTPSGSFSIVYSFGAAAGSLVGPAGPLFEAGNGILYGTCTSGGASHSGGVFSYNLESDTEKDIASVPSTSSVTSPQTGVVMAPDGNLYGAANSGNGEIFKVSPNGTWTDLYPLNSSTSGVYGIFGPLILGNDGKLYGSSTLGGTGNAGGLWSFDPATSSFKVLQEYSVAGASSVNGGYTSLTLAGNGWIYSAFNASNSAASWGIFAFQ